MNNYMIRLTVAALTMIFLAAAVIGQTEDRDVAAAASGNLYVVSAKPGGTSYLEGPVTYTKAEGKSGQLLVGDFVEAGFVVSTGSNGRAEILLNPGSFLRLDKNSAFEFTSTTLEDLSIKIHRGTAMFEVYASDDFKVNVTAGDSDFYLVKSGVYRVDVDGAGKARLEVRRGKAEVGEVDATDIKKGRAAVSDGDSVAVSKFDKSKDEFEEWSENRAKFIAKANERLIARDLGRRVLDSFRDYRWNCYDSLGLWVFNRQLSSFSFLPFGTGWRTPYGHRLRTNTMTCDYPETYWREPRAYYGPAPGTGASTGSGNTPTAPVVPQENIDRGTRILTPPFQRMQQSGDVSRSTPRSFPSDTSFPTGGMPSSGGSSRGSSKSESPPPPAPADRTPSAPSQKDPKIDN